MYTCKKECNSNDLKPNPINKLPSNGTMTGGREMSFNRAVDSQAHFHNWGLKGQHKWVGIELSWLVIRMVLLSISFIQLHNYKWGPLYAYDLTDACSIECAHITHNTIKHACSLKHMRLWLTRWVLYNHGSYIILIYIFMYFVNLL